MRAVVQRVQRASVRVRSATGTQEVGAIGRGFLVLLGVEVGDSPAAAEWIARKVASLRVFDDDDGRMNRSLRDVGGAVLLVSQFTLAADVSGGNRPSFVSAARPEEAEPLYERVVALLREAGVVVQTGRFQTSMEVELVNDGPVTIPMRSPRPDGDPAAPARA
jgi:D-tyrosyl-tRNA(Tyr) deacylase